MIIYCKQDGSVQSVPSVIPQGSLREPVTVIAPAPSAVCSLRIMPASHEALDPVIATGMEIDGEFRAYSLHLPPTVTEWPGVCRYQVMMTDANGRQTASYSGTFTIQRGAVDQDLLPGNVGELSDTSLGDMLTLLAGFQTAVIAVQTQVDKIQNLIDDGKIEGNSEEIMSYLKKLREYLSGIRVNWWSPRLAAALLSVCAGVLSLAACGAYVEGSGAETKYETLEGAVTELQTILGDMTEVGEVPTVPESSGGGTDEPTDPEGMVLSSITVSGMPEHAASGTVLSTLRASLTVTAVYSDGSRVVTEGYSLSCDSGVSLGERFEFKPGSHTVRVYLTVGDVTKSVSYTVTVAILSLTLNEETVSVYALPYTNGGLTISGTFDGQSGTVTVAAVSGYRLSNCTINGVSRTTYEVQDEAVSVVAGTVRQYAVTLNLTHAEAYTDASMNLAFTSPHYVDAGSQVSVFLIASGGYTMEESSILSSGLYDVSVVSVGGGFLVSGYVTSGNVTVTAVARDPVMQTASLSIVSAPTDGSYSAVLYAQTESGTDGETVTDWSAIPANSSYRYRLAVTPNGSYKITSGTVLTCNGATVAPYTTTQGLSYVYYITPAAGDVYALTVSTEANGSGGGDSGDTTIENGDFAFTYTYGPEGTADTEELFTDDQIGSITYTDIEGLLGRNHMITQSFPYVSTKKYVVSATAVTYTAHVQFIAFDSGYNMIGYSPYGNNDYGSIVTGTFDFTVQSGVLTNTSHAGDAWTVPDGTAHLAVFGKTKGSCVKNTNADGSCTRLYMTMTVSDA